MAKPGDNVMFNLDATTERPATVISLASDGSAKLMVLCDMAADGAKLAAMRVAWGSSVQASWTGSIGGILFVAGVNKGSGVGQFK